MLPTGYATPPANEDSALAMMATIAAILLGTRADAADQVSVQLDYVVRGNHAMFFVAREKGYFANNGIEVTAIHN